LYPPPVVGIVIEVLFDDHALSVFHVVMKWSEGAAHAVVDVLLRNTPRITERVATVPTVKNFVIFFADMKAIFRKNVSSVCIR